MSAVESRSFPTYEWGNNNYKSILPMFQEARGMYKPKQDNDEILWTHKRYTPNDLRFEVPILKYKPGLSKPKEITPDYPPLAWIPPLDVIPPRSYAKRREDSFYPSMPSTRCEEWSSIRELYPSTGAPKRITSPNWGTGAGLPPPAAKQRERLERFPTVQSPMHR